MKQRYIPFGYQLSGGTLTVHKLEAELVQTIFKRYLAGESYSKIAVFMDTSGVPYSTGASHWNKNMIGRILQNHKYTGGDGYPPLIVEDDFRQSTLLQQEKCTSKNIQTMPEVIALKKKAICGECGTPYERIFDSRVGERWKCKNAGCLTTVRIVDAYLITRVVSLLNWMIQNTQEVKISDAEVEPHNLGIMQLTNEINRELDKFDCNEDHARTLIMARAALQYEHCPDALLSEKTKRIKEMLENHTPMNGIDCGAFLQTVDVVKINPDGAVSLKLINGQIIQTIKERSSPPCKQLNA
jgi:Recombinase.